VLPITKIKPRILEQKAFPKIAPPHHHRVKVMLGDLEFNAYAKVSHTALVSRGGFEAAVVGVEVLQEFGYNDSVVPWDHYIHENREPLGDLMMHGISEMSMKEDMNFDDIKVTYEVLDPDKLHNDMEGNQLSHLREYLSELYTSQTLSRRSLHWLISMEWKVLRRLGKSSIVPLTIYY